MPKLKSRNPDHVRQHNRPSPDNEAIASQLEALLTPAITAQQAGSCVLSMLNHQKISEKCQHSKARVSKLLKFLNPNPQRFNTFSLLLIPSTIPFVVRHSKYPTISANHRLIVLTLFL